jgi:hypothetical protein
MPVPTVEVCGVVPGANPSTPKRGVGTADPVQFIAACGKTPSDNRVLALWAIDGYEHEPERWAQRINLAKHIATRIIRDYRQQVVRLATLLFENQTLTGFEIPELT